MNKNDLLLVGIVLLVSLIIFSISKVNTISDNKQALVYYENKLIKTINLDIKKEYNIQGYNGNILLETKEGSIKVKEEISPLHICSKQGWISSNNEVIVCLPNKVVIKIQSNKQDIDAVVR